MSKQEFLDTIERLRKLHTGDEFVGRVCDVAFEYINSLETALDQLVDSHDDCPPLEPLGNCPADLLAKYGSSDELCRECWKRFLMGGDE